MFREDLLPPGTTVSTKDITFTREDSGRRNLTNTEKNQHLKVSQFWPTGKGTDFTSRHHTTALPTLFSKLPAKVMCQAQCAEAPAQRGRGRGGVHP